MKIINILSSAGFINNSTFAFLFNAHYQMRRILFYLIIIATSLSQNFCTKDGDDNTNKTVIINEFMVVNNSTVADQDGEFDDWIELYNLTAEEVDLSGYYLTDSQNNLTKWNFPDGTSITPGGYLIVWADDDTLQAGLHTNYKLSSYGERVILLTPEQDILDKVEYDAQAEELAYARVPNGTGGFVWQAATFDYQND